MGLFAFIAHMPSKCDKHFLDTAVITFNNSKGQSLLKVGSSMPQAGWSIRNTDIRKAALSAMLISELSVPDCTIKWCRLTTVS
jgi:hypothetical protein